MSGLPEGVKPNLAAKTDEAAIQAFFDRGGEYLLVSVKLDGIRALVFEGAIYSRNGKLLPNSAMQKKFGGFHGCDGEMIWGDPSDDLCYNSTYRSVMAEEASIEELQFYVFDNFLDKRKYEDRLMSVVYDGVIQLHHKKVHSLAEVLEAEKEALALNHEGLMVRDPNAMYKFGKSTAKEMGLMKIKRDTDEEGLLIGVIEAKINTNPPFKDEFGRTKRSTAKEGMVPGGMAGKMVLRRVDGSTTTIGMGKFTHKERVDIWKNRDKYVGARIVKYAHFEHGAVDDIRHGRALGWRDPRDM